MRIFGIAGHGKGEVDHVAGVAKVGIRDEIARDTFFYTAESCVIFLRDKFRNKDNPNYCVKEIATGDLNELRKKAASLHYQTVDGSSQFHVLIFTPGSSTFRAAPYLCVCNECLNVEYGSCGVFKEYCLITSIIRKSVLRSNDDSLNTSNITSEPANFCTPGSICAIAANYNSSETVWFVKVLAEEVTKNSVSDNYGHTIGPNQRFLRCLMLEKFCDHKCGFEYYIPKNASDTFIYLESIVYPYVNMEHNYKGVDNKFS